jgi:hypothetical protein
MSMDKSLCVNCGSSSLDGQRRSYYSPVRKERVLVTHEGTAYPHSGEMRGMGP